MTEMGEPSNTGVRLTIIGPAHCIGWKPSLPPGTKVTEMSRKLTRETSSITPSHEKKISGEKGGREGTQAHSQKEQQPGPTNNIHEAKHSDPRELIGGKYL